MNIDWGTIRKHAQISRYSCIPSAVEMVLKLLGKAGDDYYEQQELWGNRSTGDFRPFDGETIEGVTFKIEFDDRKNPRGNNFPIEDLFQFIDKELEGGRYVIISLSSDSGWHMWIIYTKTDDDYLAFSKNSPAIYDSRLGQVVLSPEHGKITLRSEEEISEGIKNRIRVMRGTDTLTYRIAE